MDRFTLHLDHAENFERNDCTQLRLIDREVNILPYKHNRVHLKHKEILEQVNKLT